MSTHGYPFEMVQTDPPRPPPRVPPPNPEVCPGSGRRAVRCLNTVVRCLFCYRTWGKDVVGIRLPEHEVVDRPGKA